MPYFELVKQSQLRYLAVKWVYEQPVSCTYAREPCGCASPEFRRLLRGTAVLLCLVHTINSWWRSMLNVNRPRHTHTLVCRPKPRVPFPRWWDRRQHCWVFTRVDAALEQHCFCVDGCFYSVVSPLFFCFTESAMKEDLLDTRRTLWVPPAGLDSLSLHHPWLDKGFSVSWKHVGKVTSQGNWSSAENRTALLQAYLSHCSLVRQVPGAKSWGTLP